MIQEWRPDLIQVVFSCLIMKVKGIEMMKVIK